MGRNKGHNKGHSANVDVREVARTTVQALQAGKYVCGPDTPNTEPSAPRRGGGGGVEVRVDRARVQRGVCRVLTERDIAALQCKGRPQPSAPTVVLFRGGSLCAAHHLAQHDPARADGGNVCVLDFASDTNPGGGWRAGGQQGTQEEDLCRRSSLGVSLERLQYPIPLLGVAYVGEVVVVRGTHAEGYPWLPEPRWVSVIGASLRNFVSGAEPSGKELAFLDAKIDSVLRTAAAFGHQRVVLGAWGCGAFGNVSEVVAHAFVRVLSDKARPHCQTFRTVAFAVPGGDNHAAFKRVLARSYKHSLVVVEAG